MSRATSAPIATAVPMTGGNSTSVPHEKIAMRAYEKWCKRGCPQGTAQQDWFEAEKELRQEMMQTGTPAGRTAKR
ncbi:MAG: DUF2934 domain-containing protein [Gemmataceae bacterium]|nr:DUF2934 domain-containing protein [Gemmataceae bacterium]MCI0742602.1 DUF2934 domain-containing protein [Gemmataceae bacterium]